MSEQQKPTYKSTEFIITMIITLASIILASGLVSEQSTLGQILVILAGAVTGSTYVAGRSSVKGKQELRRAAEAAAPREVEAVPPTERRSTT